MTHSQPNRETLFIGIDGGGTRCRARMRDGRGRLLAEVEGGTANVYLDFETALRNVRTCILDLLVLGGAVDTSLFDLQLGLGLAGVSVPAVASRVSERLQPFGSVRVTHDADIACIGAHGGQDGGLVVAGTGSVAVARVGGRCSKVGGRGFILGDDGSGARLGLDAWRRALRAHDGLEPHSGLTRQLMDGFHDDPVAVIEWARAARSSAFADYVPMVFSFADRGDPVGLALVEASARSIAELARALLRLGVRRLALVGGLAPAIKPYLPPSVVALLLEPLFDAVEGALLLAGSPLPSTSAAERPVRGDAT